MSENLGNRLRNAKDNLSAWYDRLNSQWSDAERTLKSLHLSRNVWVSFKQESIECGDDPTLTRDFEYNLGFAKRDGDWGIFYALGETGDPDSFEPRRILECTLEERKLALTGIPPLLAAIVTEAEVEAARLETALGAAAESLSSFKSLK